MLAAALLAIYAARACPTIYVCGDARPRPGRALHARYALVHQYRADVAFLMGDPERAKRALRKALEIEPDNASFKANIERLDREQ
ncbi:MAG: tetratricopeptide repeat protein [Candidatus Binatia bacterium]